MAASVKSAAAEFFPALESNRSGTRTTYTPWRGRGVRQVSAAGSYKFATKTTALSVRKCVLASVLISLATAFLISKCYEFVSHGRFKRGEPRSLASGRPHEGISCPNQLTGSGGGSGSSSVAEPSESASSRDATGAAASGANEPHACSGGDDASEWGFFIMPQKYRTQAVDMLHRISKMTQTCRSLVTKLNAESRTRLAMHMSVVVCVEIAALAFVPHALQHDRRRAAMDFSALVDDVFVLNSADKGLKPVLKELARFQEFLQRLANVPQRSQVTDLHLYKTGAELQHTLGAAALSEVEGLLHRMMEAVKREQAQMRGHPYSTEALELELRVLETVGRVRKVQLLRNTYCRTWMQECQETMRGWMFFTVAEVSLFASERPPRRILQLIEFKTAIRDVVRASATQYPQAAAALLRALGAFPFPAAQQIPVDTAGQVSAAAAFHPLLTTALPATRPAGNSHMQGTAPALAHPQGGAVHSPFLPVLHVYSASRARLQQPAQHVLLPRLAPSVVVTAPVLISGPHVSLQPDDEERGTSRGPWFGAQPMLQDPSEQAAGGSSSIQLSELDAEEENLESTVASSTVEDHAASGYSDLDAVKKISRFFLKWKSRDDEAENPERVVAHSSVEDLGTSSASGYSDSDSVEGISREELYLKWKARDDEAESRERAVAHSSVEGISRLFSKWKARDEEAENPERAVAHSSVEDYGASSVSEYADSGTIGSGSAAYSEDGGDLNFVELISDWKKNNMDGSGDGADGNLGIRMSNRRVD